MDLPSSLCHVPGYHGFNIPHPAPEPVLLMAPVSSTEKSSAIFLSTWYVSIPLFSLLPSKRTLFPAAATVLFDVCKQQRLFPCLSAGSGYLLPQPLLSWKAQVGFPSPKTWDKLLCPLQQRDACDSRNPSASLDGAGGPWLAKRSQPRPSCSAGNSPGMVWLLGQLMVSGVKSAFPALSPLWSHPSTAGHSAPLCLGTLTDIQGKSFPPEIQGEHILYLRRQIKCICLEKFPSKGKRGRREYH